MKNVLCQISTHWDREWYRPFQSFRYYLVVMVDGLISALESGSLPRFVFDGQTIVIEDYLEIRPENRQRLERLIAENKIVIGPWYVMPDELIVSGESLIENLLEGQKISRSFGVEPWKFGYVNDVFGHIAQFPQILNGFGIKCAYLGRGVSGEYPNNSSFIWRSPDGSECYVYKDCYANLKKEFDKSEDSEQYIKNKVDSAPDGLPVLLNYTDDHAVVDENTIRFIEALRKADCNLSDGFELFADIADKYRDKLPQISGELVNTAYLPSEFRLVTSSISSYYPLKQKNVQCENLLYREIGPCIVMSEMLGILKDKHMFFETARKYLLKNHPHDSICGCSVDEVHKNMPYRFAQVEAIADVVNEDFRDKLKKKYSSESQEFSLLVVNNDAAPRDGVITVQIDFPTKWASVYTDNTGYQNYNTFDITDCNGKSLPYQILKIERGVETYQRQSTIIVNRYTVAFNAQLYAFGVTPFKVVPSAARKLIPPQYPSGALFAENEYLRLSIEADGSLTVTDKETGRIYRKLNEFTDEGDSGNGWFYGEVAFDAPTVSSGTVRIEVINRGALVDRFRITMVMEVPCETEYKKYRRSENICKMLITTVVTLRKGERFVELEATVGNTASGHRLSVLFPSEISGDDYTASQAFCFLKRKRGVSECGLNSREPELIGKNTSGIVSVGGGQLSFIGAEGFHEAGVYPDGTVSVTMFRSVGRMFHQPEAVYAQLKGEMKFHYAIAFNTPESELMRLQQNMRDRLTVIFGQGLHTDAMSLMNISDRRILSSVIKPAESGDGWTVRLFNPTGEAVSCEFTGYHGVEIYEADMSETVRGKDMYIGKIVLSFKAYEVHTLLIK